MQIPLPMHHTGKNRPHSRRGPAVVAPLLVRLRRTLLLLLLFWTVVLLMNANEMTGRHLKSRTDGPGRAAAGLCVAEGVGDLITTYSEKNGILSAQLRG